MNNPAPDDAAWDCFERGDYQSAARLTGDPVLKGLAQIMIGNQWDGLPLLAGIDTADPGIPARTAATVALGHWLDGRPDEARAVLSARRDDVLSDLFLDMLTGGPVPCIFQSARAPLLTSCKQVDGFTVTTVGSGGQVCDIDLDDNDRTGIAEALDKAAFLFGFDFAGPPPARPKGSTVPYLIHLTDPDVHVLTGLHPVRQYDGAIAGTAGQAHAIREITGTATVSAPFFGGLSAVHPSLAGPGTASTQREVDLFFSGSYGTPIYHEKPARFFAISQIPDRYRVELFDSTRPLDDYAAGLRNAKFALVSVRAPGSFSTRAMQALECGAFVLCEADSGVLDYFPGEDWGVFTYRPDHVAEDIARHLSRYIAYRARLAPRQDLIRQRLAALSPGSPLAEERWLKYSAFLALLIRHDGPLRSRPPCVEPPLDWFTVRGFPAPLKRRADLPSRARSFSALARQAREAAGPPADWLAEDGALTPLTGPPARQPVLQNELPGAFLRVAETWVNRDRAGFEAACEAVWCNRDIYMAQELNEELNGLAVPDFWLGVFLNRLGLPLGRLYQEAVTARVAKCQSAEAALLVGALGMITAERAWASGATSEAADRARAVLAIDRENHAAAALVLLDTLRNGEHPAAPVLETLAPYPWHLPRILQQLTGKEALDRSIAKGDLHRVYLKFFQRMRDSRPLLSPTRVPAGAAAYLAWKLTLNGAGSVAHILDTLRREGLLLVDEETAARRIAEPILAVSGR